MYLTAPMEDRPGDRAAVAVADVAATAAAALCASPAAAYRAVAAACNTVDAKTEEAADSDLRVISNTLVTVQQTDAFVLWARDVSCGRQVYQYPSLCGPLQGGGRKRLSAGPVCRVRRGLFGRCGGGGGKGRGHDHRGHRPCQASRVLPGGGLQKEAEAAYANLHVVPTTTTCKLPADAD